jgi:hypothetical protein
VESDHLPEPDPTRSDPLSQSEWIDICAESGWAGTSYDWDYRPAPSVVADHLEQLMRDAFAQTRHLSEERLEAVLWVIFGANGAFFEIILHEGAVEDQVRVYRAFSHFYVTEVPLMCPNEQTSSAGGAIYMIWDMDSAEIPLYHPDRWPHLTPVIESCFETVLGSTTNDVSVRSILHALFDARFGRPAIESLCRRLAQVAGVTEETRDILIGIADGSDLHP